MEYYESGFFECSRTNILWGKLPPRNNKTWWWNEEAAKAIRRKEVAIRYGIRP